MPPGENLFLAYALSHVKPALRVSTESYDDFELMPLIEAAVHDMRRVGIVINANTSEEKPLLMHAIVLYCKGHFGSRDDAAAMRECYAGLRDAMSLSSEYTTEPEENNSGSPEGGCV